MSNGWAGEWLAIERFARDLELRLALPDVAQEELENHARQVAHLQDLLSLVATLPPEKRPPVVQWDELLGPLWRKLFAKGDDAARHILADLWRRVLLEAGETERYLRSCTAVAASARNFSHFAEALECCRDGREASAGRPSAALANLINTEGIIYSCQENWDAAESSYRESMAMGFGLTEEDIARWTGLTRTDFQAQGLLNILDSLIHRGYQCPEDKRKEALPAIRQIEAELDSLPISEGLRCLLTHHRAEIQILEGRLTEAKSILLDLVSNSSRLGPYQVSLTAVHVRLLSYVAQLEGDWQEAYRWIRMALKEGPRQSYLMEEQFVVDQAVRVLRGLHDSRDIRTHEALVQDLVLLLEDKDWYTGRSHSRSVSRLAIRLGEMLNQTRGWNLDLDNLRTSGLLHDVGKLRIPWSLLNKIAPITPREMDLLREHSALGGELLRKMGLDDVARVVEQHHESMDGTGYPSGRPPDPDSAVVAVCDAYEATITPNRRYKQPKSSASALAELITGSGRKYHPEVVDALLALVQRQAESGN